MDNDNNLGDFFRKRLNQTDGSSDGWDMPDPELRASVLASISSGSGRGGQGKKIMLIIIPIIIFAFLIGYIFKLKNDLRNAVMISTIEIPKRTTSSYFSNLNTKALNSVLKHQLKNQENSLTNLISENKKLKNKITSFIPEIQEVERLVYVEDQELINQQNSIIAELRNRISSLESIINSKEEKPAFTPLKILDVATLPLEEKREYDIPPLIPIYTNNIYEENWEFGYNYRHSITALKTERDFGIHRATAGAKQEDRFVHKQHGITASRKLTPYFWITGGISFQKWNLARSSNTSLAYNPEGEEIITGEGIRTRINSENRTYLGNTNNNTSLLLEDGQLPSEGDLIEVAINDELSGIGLRVPLSLNYYQNLGKGRFILTTGVQYNWLQTRDYKYGINISSNDTEYYNRNLISTDIEPYSVGFFGFHSGLAFDYPVARDFRLRASLDAGYNFHKGSQLEKFNSGISLGIIYSLKKKKEVKSLIQEFEKKKKKLEKKDVIYPRYF